MIELCDTSRSNVIYCITNLITDKRYIGQTTQTLRERLYLHEYHHRGKMLIGKSISKHGSENFSVEILAECEDIDELNSLEEELISTYGTTFPDGYNLRSGGNNSKHSQSTIDKIRKATLQSHEVITPEGYPLTILDLPRFCQENGLKYPTMMKVLHGKINSHKGYRTKKSRTRQEVRELRASSKKKSGKVCSPTGEVFEFDSIQAFCDRTGLNPSSIAKLLRGEISNHKGWTRCE